MDKTKAVDKPESALTVLANSLEGEANLGMEETTYEDLLIPRLKILQDGSPETKERDTAYMPDAKVGHIVDSVYGINYGEQIQFIPAIYRREYVEWRPREQGGGLANVHSNRQILESAQRREGRLTLPNGNTISPTLNFFGFVWNDEAKRFDTVVISMASTQLKKGKQIITLAKQDRLVTSQGVSYVPPMYARCYLLGTNPEGNAKGDWMGWTVNRGVSIDQYSEFEGFQLDEFLASARSTVSAVKSENFKVDPEENTEQQQQTSEDDTPF